MSFDDVVRAVAAVSRGREWFHTRRGIPRVQLRVFKVKVPVGFQTEESEEELATGNFAISTGIGTVAIQRSLTVGK